MYFRERLRPVGVVIAERMANRHTRRPKKFFYFCVPGKRRYEITRFHHQVCPVVPGFRQYGMQPPVAVGYTIVMQNGKDKEFYFFTGGSKKTVAHNKHANKIKGRFMVFVEIKSGHNISAHEPYSLWAGYRKHQK